MSIAKVFEELGGGEQDTEEFFFYALHEGQYIVVMDTDRESAMKKIAKELKHKNLTEGHMVFLYWKKSMGDNNNLVYCGRMELGWQLK
jgi:hypothetical protein